MATFDSLTCDSCHSIVDNPTTSGKIQFICTACHKVRESKPDDSLMSSGSIQDSSDNSQYECILRYAANMPYNPKAENVKCPKCKKTDNVRYIRLGTEEKKVYACSCGKDEPNFIFT